MPNDILSAASFRSLSDEDQAIVKARCQFYLEELDKLNDEPDPGNPNHYLGHDAANINFELSAREKNLNHITSAKFERMDDTRKTHELAVNLTESKFPSNFYN